MAYNNGKEMRQTDHCKVVERISFIDRGILSNFYGIGQGVLHNIAAKYCHIEPNKRVMVPVILELFLSNFMYLRASLLSYCQ